MRAVTPVTNRTSFLSRRMVCCNFVNSVGIRERMACCVW